MARPLQRNPDGHHAGALVCPECSRTSISVLGIPKSCAHCGWKNPTIKANRKVRERWHERRKKLDAAE